MLHVAILLLSSGSITLCSHFHREYYLINQTKTWEEAQTLCRQNYTDLAVIGSHDDRKRLANVAAANGLKEEVWIGLKEIVHPSSWMWSIGETPTSHGSAEYTNWASSPSSSHHCGGMRDDGKWLSAVCDTKLPFACQEDMESRNIHVVPEEKTWRQAQMYCRLNYVDLATVRSQTENQALQKVVEESGLSVSMVWMGLFRDWWKWSDQSDSSFRYWQSNQPNDDGECSLYNPTSDAWFDRGCTYPRMFFCYKRVEVKRLTIVRVGMKSNVLSILSDLSAGNAILKTIQNKTGLVKLQWRLQPDGKIFQKMKDQT
ncbi:secretory phospholipase A2 receptor-like [Xyrichtys novacula]|uniref:Secretory phospholipase A2 receptor-like n=1 Tax=Xyrichtys novacula TaxID=13765 RepID=A0AAV1H4P6_XYRNO|nr:secretory phospholipase A2 receptor-like [Xyrichtys novacula]